MSAIREVKYLRELKHQNIIEVRILKPTPLTQRITLTARNIASGRLLLKNKLESRP
jgi:hypothetical protein